jgi:hypothetical protein
MISYGSLTLCYLHSVPISTKVVSSNPIDGEVIQDVRHLRHVGGYLLVFRITPSIKLTSAIWLKYFESGFKYRIPNPILTVYLVQMITF